MRRILALVLLTVAYLAGQDTFEIQVYEYETVPKGMWNLETHLNFVQSGVRDTKDLSRRRTIRHT